MTMPPGEGDDWTQPAPSAAGSVGPSDPTVPAPGLGEETVAATSTGTGPPGPGGPAPPEEGDAWERHPGPLLAAATAAGLIVGALLGLVVGGGGTGHVASSTTTSSSTTSTSTTTTSSTTTTTTPAAPQILGFSASPSNPTCSAGARVDLTWSTQGAQAVELFVDGTALGTFGPTGSSGAPFGCPPFSHTYRLTATGAGGLQSTRSVTVTAASPPTTATSTTTTSTTLAP